MTCLRDIKYLTKKKVLALQPIYYVRAGLKIQNKVICPMKIIKYAGQELEKAIDNFLLADAHACFTTEQEANDFINERNTKE